MFVGRNKNGEIYGAWTCPQPDDDDHQGIEEVADDDPELLAYINRPQPVPVDKRSAAIDAMLAQMAGRPDAPQAVKDYVNSATAKVTS